MNAHSDIVGASTRSGMRALLFRAKVKPELSMPNRSTAQAHFEELIAAALQASATSLAAGL
jgi:hypothetical protein